MIKTNKWQGILIAVIVLASCVAAFLLVDFPKKKPTDEPSNTTQSTVSDDVTKYSVTFYSNDGTVLKIDSVKENSSATPPITPVMTYGKVFKSWDTDFSSVTQDLDVHPVCEEIKGKPNVIAVQSAYATTDTAAVVPIRLCGDVCVAGFDITIRYDQDQLKLKSITEDKAVVYNDATLGIIKINYVSTQNTVADVDICNLLFYVNKSEGEIPVTIEINGIYAFKDESQTDELYIPESTIIDGKVFVVK